MKWSSYDHDTYNSRVNPTTKVSPYFAVFGRHPPTFDVNLPPALSKISAPLDDAASALHRQMGIVHRFIADSLARAQIAMASRTDASSRHVTFKVGDSVLLHAGAADGLPLFNLHNTAHKLQPRWIGPFTIKARRSNGRTYILDLPAHMMIHPAIDVTKLRLFQRSDESLFPRRNLLAPLPTQRNGAMEYDVHSIIKHRFFGKGKRLEFLVQWKGYDKSNATWETRDAVKHARAITNAYMKKHNLS